MPSSPDLQTARQMARHWSAPDLGAVSNAPVACVATTFEFHADYYESDLLPRFLNLQGDSAEDEAAYRQEREEELAKTRVAVLVDQSRFSKDQSTLRWDQVPIAVPSPLGVQHAKLTLLAWERCIRLIVGSANLTGHGYRRNREVFVSLDFRNERDSTPRQPLLDAIGLMDTILGWARAPDGMINRVRQAIASVRELASSWNEMPEDFTARQRPRFSLVNTCPGPTPQSALTTMIRTWGRERKISTVTAVTPFVGKNVEQDLVLRTLQSETRLDKACEGWIAGPRMDTEAKKPVLPFPAAFGRAWAEMFPGGAHICPVPGLDPEHRARKLHAKALAFQGDGRCLLMVGSSNFTPHGLGVGNGINVEANLLYTLDSGEFPDLVDWSVSTSVDAVDWKDNEDPESDDTLADRVTLPRFFKYATYSQKTGLLRLEVDRDSAAPSHWSVSLRSVNSFELFDKTAQKDGMYTHTFDEDQRTIPLTYLIVRWCDDAGTTLECPMLLTVAALEDLAPPRPLGRFGLDAMIACLIRGLSLADWTERNGGASSRSANDRNNRPEIDTSGYLLYRVKAFGRALAGLRERIERTAVLPAAMAYRWGVDPLGPVALAVALADGSGSGDFARMTPEHRSFLLAEVLLAASAAAGALRSADRAWLDPILDAGLDKIRESLELARSQLRSTSCTAYIDAVQRRVSRCP